MWSVGSMILPTYPGKNFLHKLLVKHPGYLPGVWTFTNTWHISSNAYMGHGVSKTSFWEGERSSPHVCVPSYCCWFSYDLNKRTKTYSVPSKCYFTHLLFTSIHECRYTYNVAGKYTPLETSRWHISQKFIPTKEKNTCLYIPQRPFWRCTKIYTHMHSDWRELSSRWRIEEAYFCATASRVPIGAPVDTSKDAMVLQKAPICTSPRNFRGVGAPRASHAIKYSITSNYAADWPLTCI